MIWLVAGTLTETTKDLRGKRVKVLHWHYAERTHEALAVCIEVDGRGEPAAMKRPHTLRASNLRVPPL